MLNSDNINFKEKSLFLDQKRKTCSKCNEILSASNHDCISSLIESHKKIKAQNN